MFYSSSLIETKLPPVQSCTVSYREVFRSGAGACTVYLVLAHDLRRPTRRDARTRNAQCEMTGTHTKARPRAGALRWVLVSGVDVRTPLKKLN